MKTSSKYYIVIVFVLIVLLVIVGFSFYFFKKTGTPTPIGNQGVIDCGDNYDCLYRNISNGASAKVTISEKIYSLSLEEKSEVRIVPSNHQFNVFMTVLELNKIEKTQPMTKSMVGSVSESCPQIVNNLSSIELASASCIANTAEEARNLAKDGLSDTTISRHSCKGELIDEIKRICIRPDFPNFPPGVKKPAVYLYPLQESKISVAVNVKGIITKSEPNYYKGWEVIAKPNGLINGKYDYLFYEAQLEHLQLPNEGWVVEYKELENWFDLNLKKLGLNEKEIFQFKEYWLAELPFARYYEIKLLGDSFLKENMNLVINPIPKTVIRRNFYFKPLESQIIFEQPNIITPKRKGFTVVEWGGLIDDKQ